MFYLATDRLNDLAKIEKQYKSITGVSLSADLKQKYPQWFNGEAVSHPVVFEIPKKITAAALPDSIIIQRGQCSPGGILLDFSQVQEIDNDGLKKLAQLFSSLAQENTRPKLRQADRFITCCRTRQRQVPELVQYGMYCLPMNGSAMTGKLLRKKRSNLPFFMGFHPHPGNKRRHHYRLFFSSRTFSINWFRTEIVSCGVPPALPLVRYLPSTTSAGTPVSLYCRII